MTLSDKDLETIKLGETLSKDYFYIPIITHEDPEDFPDAKVYSLRFSKKKPPESLMQYASKVPSGKTLWEALRNDLRKDFHYPEDKSFLIDRVQIFDTAKNKQGKELPRVLIYVEVFHKFDTKSIHPVGLSPYWKFEDYHTNHNPVIKYF